MKFVLRVILTATLLGVLGCASADSDKVRFDRIAKDLDMGGSCYFISSSRHAGTALEKLIKEHERYIWSSSFTPELQFKLQRFISCSELLGRIAGLHEIKGWGAAPNRSREPGRYCSETNCVFFSTRKAMASCGICFHRKTIPSKNTSTICQPIPLMRAPLCWIHNFWSVWSRQKNPFPTDLPISASSFSA